MFLFVLHRIITFILSISKTLIRPIYKIISITNFKNPNEGCQLFFYRFWRFFKNLKVLQFVCGCSIGLPMDLLRCRTMVYQSDGMHNHDRETWTFLKLEEISISTTLLYNSGNRSDVVVYEQELKSAFLVLIVTTSCLNIHFCGHVGYRIIFFFFLHFKKKLKENEPQHSFRMRVYDNCSCM